MKKAGSDQKQNIWLVDTNLERYSEKENQDLMPSNDSFTSVGSCTLREDELEVREKKTDKVTSDFYKLSYLLFGMKMLKIPISALKSH